MSKKTATIKKTATTMKTPEEKLRQEIQRDVRRHQDKALERHKKKNPTKINLPIGTPKTARGRL